MHSVQYLTLIVAFVLLGSERGKEDAVAVAVVGAVVAVAVAVTVVVAVGVASATTGSSVQLEAKSALVNLG